ncbi:uncharacterized protein LOC121853241 [Homarus americanus]|uniref:uncharacterized protein LOC121853241 n=1 Tax=Homarus americanus TaxID=6706 RepID=UPI001C48FD86|nr:uncharacterized protein LOC121853241 [Homarus americanus]
MGTFFTHEKAWCKCTEEGLKCSNYISLTVESRKSRDLSSAPTPSPGNFNRDCIGPELWREGSCNWCGCRRERKVCTDLINCTDTEVVVCIPESVYLNHCGRKCTCSSQGRFVCDPDRCRAETEVEGQVCDHVYLLLDECNWCMCVNGRITCTHDTCVTTNHSNYHNQPAFSTTNHPNYGYTSDLTTTNHSNYHNQPALTTTNHPNYHNSPALTTTNQSTRLEVNTRQDDDEP